jgi:hypothetical protein
MTPWIALSSIVAFYLLGPLFWGIRGAIICFLLPPATSLLIGIYILVHGTNLGASKFTIYPSKWSGGLPGLAAVRYRGVLMPTAWHLITRSHLKVVGR